ncbi:MAG: aryl-sulfate sulfotransferase [Myxococcota bacterium]
MMGMVGLLACTTPLPPLTEVSSTSPSEPDSTSAPVCPGTSPQPTVRITPHPDLANLQTATVTLSTAAPVALRCTAAADPSDQLFWESADVSMTHTVALGGLVAEREYRCAAAVTCPPSAPTAFDLTTTALPPRIPATTVETHATLQPDAAHPHFIVNHTRHCEDDVTHRLLVYDLAGDLRWYYNQLPGRTPIAINAHYAGQGRFVWGGGWTREGATEMVGLDQSLLDKAAFPGSQPLIFHHEGRRLPDGRLLTLTQSRNDVGGPDWEGFTVRLVDPEADAVTWSWDSQQGVDAGLLPTGTGDVYHANAAEVFDTDEGPVVVVSLCYTTQIIAVDMATERLRWRFGPGGDFTLRDAQGGSLPDSEYPDCQHGIELVDGNRLLVYDNGRNFRSHSRASEYVLDEVTMTATLVWTWTEPQWHEGALGDIDRLSEDRLLITEAHPDCWSFLPGDLSATVEVDRPTGEVAWRHRFLDPMDATYRSDRFDGCDAFPQIRYCPTVAARASALSKILPDP